MGVIWNPDKISYMLDTNIIKFYEFEISGGGGGKGASPGGEERPVHYGAAHFWQ